MQPTRILMGIPAVGATGGGTALPIPMLVEDLRRDGNFEVRTFPYGRWREGESLPLKVLHQLVDLARYPARIARADPELVHLHSAFDRKAILRDVVFGLLTLLSRRPLLVEWHGAETELLKRPRAWRFLAALLLRTVRGLAVLATEIRTDVLGTGFGKPCPVVKNPLDLGRYARRVDLRRRLRVDGDPLLLLFIARLIPAKGLLDVVEALGHLPRHVHLVVVGDGPDRTPAANRVRHLGLGSRVHFMGHVSEAATLDFYCGCDVLVLPTYASEGFPMSIFQAVASGLGIVTTRIRAASDHLSDPEHCLFVPPRDPDAIAAAVERLLRDADLLQRMQHANRELSRRFERRLVAQEFGDLYLQLLGRPAMEPAASAVRPPADAAPTAPVLDPSWPRPRRGQAPTGDA